MFTHERSNMCITVPCSVRRRPRVQKRREKLVFFFASITYGSFGAVVLSWSLSYVTDRAKRSRCLGLMRKQCSITPTTLVAVLFVLFLAAADSASGTKPQLCLPLSSSCGCCDQNAPGFVSKKCTTERETRLTYTISFLLLSFRFCRCCLTQTHSGHVLLSGTTLLDQTDGGHGEPERSTGSKSTAMGASLPGETMHGASANRWVVAWNAVLIN